MLITSWLDSLRSPTSLHRRSRGRSDRRAPRMASAAEFLEDRLMLSSSTPDLSRIVASAETASPDDYASGEMLVRFNPGFTDAEKSTAVANLAQAFTTG